MDLADVLTGSRTEVSTLVSVLTNKLRVLARATATSTAGPGAYFARWTNHDTWTQWDLNTEWVRLDGPVRVGTCGVLKPRRGPKVKFVISACTPDREYTDTSRLPGARLVFQHTIMPSEQGSDLAVLVTISGPLAFVWAKIMRSSFAGSAQTNLDRLVHLVEQP